MYIYVHIYTTLIILSSIVLPMLSKCVHVGEREVVFVILFFVLPLLADGICNAGGLGYDSLASDESKRWSLTTMVDVYRIELATNARELISGWNLPTMNWLRR